MKYKIIEFFISRCSKPNNSKSSKSTLSLSIDQPSESARTANLATIHTPPTNIFTSVPAAYSPEYVFISTAIMTKCVLLDHICPIYMRQELLL